VRQPLEKWTHHTIKRCRGRNLKGGEFGIDGFHRGGILDFAEIDSEEEQNSKRGLWEELRLRLARTLTEKP
jgi:hypothetical protein